MVVLLLGLTLLALTFLVGDRHGAIAVLHVAVILTALAGLGLVKRGHSRRAAIVLVLAGFAVVTVSVVLFGGTRSPAFFLHSALVLLAGFMWSERAAVAIAVASCAAAAAIAIGETRGLVPQPLVPASPLRLFESLVANLLITTFALFFATRRMQENLLEAEGHAQAAREARRAADRHARQQTAVARLGERALASRALDAFFDECIEVVARVLDAEFAKLLELAPDRSELVLRAGVGWKPGWVGQARVPADRGSQAGFTLESEAPVLVRDFETETRFAPPALLGDHGVRSGVSVVIRLEEKAFGVLGVHSRTPDAFVVEDLPFLEAVANLISAALSRAELETRMARSQQLEALGRLAGGVAHDFNNVLAVILNYADAFEEAADAAALRAAAGEIRGAAERAASLTRDLLAFARHEPARPATVVLNDVVSRSSQMLGRLLGERYRLALRLDPDPHPIWADPGRVERILVNLVLNARDAMPGGGTIEVETTNRIGCGADRVRLAVRDEGVGMTPEVRERAFEPFFTTKPAGRGSGLGLSTVYGLVRQVDGEIQIRSHPGVGTSVEIEFPRAADAEAATEPAALPEREAAPSRSETVLLAEDDDRLRAVLARALAQAGYEVLPARDGASAIAQAEHHPGPIDVLVTDLVMPGASGLDVGAAIRRARPSIRTIYMSGYSETEAALAEARRAGAIFLQKPFRSQTLLRVLRETPGGDTPSAAPAGRRGDAV